MDGTSLSDFDLITACFRREKDGWAAFVARYSKLIYHTVFQTLRIKKFQTDRNAVDEIYQEVFLQLMNDDCRKLRQFTGRNNCTLATWLRVVASRETLDYIRNRIRDESKRVDPQADEDPLEHLRSGDEPADLLIERKQQNKILEDLKKTLSPRDRLLYELAFRDELSDPEISTIMHMTVNNVAVSKSRIKQRLKELAAKVACK